MADQKVNHKSSDKQINVYVCHFFVVSSRSFRRNSNMTGLSMISGTDVVDFMLISPGVKFTLKLKLDTS